MRQALQVVAPEGASIPCSVAESGDRATAVMCDATFSWDEGKLGSELAVPLMLARLRDENGPLLDATVAALTDLGREIAPRLTPGDFGGAGFAAFVARVSPTAAELVSVGAIQALHLRRERVIARTRRQLLGEFLREEGKLTPEQELVFPQRYVWTSSVNVHRDGTVDVIQPLAERWELQAGDVLVIASVRLADRLAGLEGRALMRLVDGGWRAKRVAALPLLPEHDDEYRSSERQYSTVTFWL
jgi:hypothetical protein